MKIAFESIIRVVALLGFMILYSFLGNSRNARAQLAPVNPVSALESPEAVTKPGLKLRAYSPYSPREPYWLIEIKSEGTHPESAEIAILKNPRSLRVSGPYPVKRTIDSSKKFTDRDTEVIEIDMGSKNLVSPIYLTQLSPTRYKYDFESRDPQAKDIADVVGARKIAITKLKHGPKRATKL